MKTTSIIFVCKELPRTQIEKNTAPKQNISSQDGGLSNFSTFDVLQINYNSVLISYMSLKQRKSAREFSHWLMLMYGTSEDSLLRIGS